MKRAYAIKVKPALLLWARKTTRTPVKVLARALRVSPERLHAFETGKATCTVKQLRKISEVCKLPLAVFFLPQPPRFRVIRGGKS